MTGWSFRRLPATPRSTSIARRQIRRSPVLAQPPRRTRQAPPSPSPRLSKEARLSAASTAPRSRYAKALRRITGSDERPPASSGFALWTRRGTSTPVQRHRNSDCRPSRAGNNHHQAAAHLRQRTRQAPPSPSPLSEQGSTFECSLDAALSSPLVRAPGPTRGSRVALERFWYERRTRWKTSTRLRLAAPGRLIWSELRPQILTAPPAATNSTSASFTFMASEQGTTFECSLDGALFSQCASPKAYSGLRRRHAPFLRARGRTVGPNTNTGPEVLHTWRVDARAPSAAVASGPPGLTNSRSATFAFSADEPSSFQCRVDAGALAPCSSPISYQNLADGAHTFVAVPTDAVGNAGASGS